MKHLVLLDIDGTIMHNGGAGRESMEEALTAVFGTAGDPAYRYDGKTDRQIVREQMTASGIASGDIDAAMDRVLAEYVSKLAMKLSERGRDVGLFPGIRELITAVEIRDDSVLGLLTGNIEDGARMKLEAVGLDFTKFLVNAFGSDDETRGRLPGIAHERMRGKFGVTLEGRDVVVIGDTPSDIECGRALGARAIGVATGRYSVAELSEYAPFAVFQDLSDTNAVMRAIGS